ncbi:MAG: DUF1802 family protein [Rhizonema sp. NSF051]|nr:DUF1802 family protein [Rhizonema sp. NSF051]
MSEIVLLDIALSLPAPDIEALIQGQMIAALAPRWMNQGEQFALYPANISMNLGLLKDYYRSSFLSTAQKVFANLGSEKVLIQAWAKCELCQMLNTSESLNSLSELAIWTTEALQQRLKHRPYIFLAFLRVYLLPQQIEMPIYTQRNFVPLPQQLNISEVNPVLSDRIFNLRKHQLETRQPPLHPELEELQSEIASLATTHPAANELDRDIKVFLGWSSKELVEQPESEAWIDKIAALGDRSIKEDDGKSNYQAGTDFENIVRQSLEFLGFTVDYCHKGGAGGLDLLCLKPYPLFGECKAGKKNPNLTAVQLLNLGTLRRSDLFNQGTKLIIGPGELTEQLKNAAQIHSMAIINPKTLENLVKLQSIYRNSIDLFKLKEYLKAGQSDEEIEKYIEQIYREIRLRSQIVQAVQELREQDNANSGITHQCFTVTEIRAHYNATHKDKLTDNAVHNLLVELSSPLTGYLGRQDWKSDRFYFLRDLPVI